MAEIDTSIYKQNLAPDIAGAFQQGMGMRRQMQQNQIADQQIADDAAVRDAYKQSTVVGPDGMAKLDENMLISNLSKASPQLAVVEQQKIAERNAAAQAKKLELYQKQLETSGRLFSGVKDQASYDNARAQAIKIGMFEPGEIPPVYDERFVNYIQMRTLSAKEQLDYQLREREVRAKEREAGGGPGGTPGKITEAQSKALGFGRRAMLADQIIERVTNDPKADVSSLKTQIKSGLPKWLGGAKNQREQDIATAKLSFIASVLRKESGAAVTPQEFAQYDSMYFPQPGDSPETLADKSVMRKNFIDTEKMSAGSAWRDPIPLTKRPEGKSPAQKILKTADIEWAD